MISSPVHRNAKVFQFEQQGRKHAVSVSDTELSTPLTSSNAISHFSISTPLQCYAIIKKTLSRIRTRSQGFSQKDQKHSPVRARLFTHSTVRWILVLGLK